MFSGAVTRMAIFALGIMPYISSSIIVQLLTGVSDYFKNLKEQGEIEEKNYPNNKIRNSFNCSASRIWSFCRIRKCRQFGYRTGNVFQNYNNYFSSCWNYFFNVVRWANNFKRSRKRYFINNFFRYSCRDTKSFSFNLELGRTGALSAIMIVGIFILVILTVLFIVFFERAMRKYWLTIRRDRLEIKCMEEFTSSFKDKHCWSNSSYICLSFTTFTYHYFKFWICRVWCIFKDFFNVYARTTLYMLLYASGIIFFHFFIPQLFLILRKQQKIYVSMVDIFQV